MRFRFLISLLGDVSSLPAGKACGPIPSESDGSLLLQAALLVPEGFGIIAWDREEYLAARNSSPRNREARLRFVPFNELGSALKTLLLPQIDPLLAELLRTIRPTSENADEATNESGPR